MIARLRRFPYKTVCVLGTLYLLLWFIGGLHPSTWQIICLPLTLCLLAGICGNIVAIFRSLQHNSWPRFRVVAIRAALYLAILVLTIPVARLGHYIRIQLFLAELPRYQRVVDAAVEKESFDLYGAPKRIDLKGADAELAYWLYISCDENHVVTANFLTNGFGIPPHHQGYLFRSDDDISALKSTVEFRDMFFVQVAPHWYSWSD